MPRKQYNIASSLAHTKWNLKYHIDLRRNIVEKFFMKKKEWRLEKY